MQNMKKTKLNTKTNEIENEQQQQKRKWSIKPMLFWKVNKVNIFFDRLVK